MGRAGHPQPEVTTTTTTTTPPPVTGNELARTGTNAALWSDIAVGLIVAGTWLLVLARRVRASTVRPL